MVAIDVHAVKNPVHLFVILAPHVHMSVSCSENVNWVHSTTGYEGSYHQCICT